MIFHLDGDIFNIVKNGTKNVEVRLNDKKRQKLIIGGELIFLKRPYDDEEIKATITDLKKFNNIDDLLDYYSMDRIYIKDCTKSEFINIVNRFYSNEEIEEFGFVAIEFKQKKE